MIGLRIVLGIAIAHCALGAFASEKVVSSAARDEAIREILKEFWGRARDVHSEPIQPDSELDRRTVPISRAAAYRAIEAGNVSAAAEWCELEWEPHYFALTRAARSMGMTDKQVAFVSFLHGAGQEAYSRFLEGRTCTVEERARVIELRDGSQGQGLPSDALSTW